MSDYIQQAEKLLQEAANEEDVKRAIEKLREAVFTLLSGYYKTNDKKLIISRFLNDVAKTREYVLALYILVPYLFELMPDVIDNVPEDVLRLYLSNMIVLYEKSRHILGIL
jgi:hypothetical protein